MLCAKVDAALREGNAADLRGGQAELVLEQPDGLHVEHIEDQAAVAPDAVDREEIDQTARCERGHLEVVPHAHLPQARRGARPPAARWCSHARAACCARAS